MHIPVLMFHEGGWCQALGESYRPGPHQARTAEEYRALAPFAVDAPELAEDAPATEAPAADAPELAKRGPGRPRQKG